MDGSQEWAAVVGCICAASDKSLLPKGLYHGWFAEVNGQNAEPAHFDKGCMTDRLAIEWLQAFVMAIRVCMKSAMHGWSSRPLQP